MKQKLTYVEINKITGGICDCLCLFNNWVTYSLGIMDNSEICDQTCRNTGGIHSMGCIPPEQNTEGHRFWPLPNDPATVGIVNIKF